METSSLETQIRQRTDSLEHRIVSEIGSLVTPPSDNEKGFVAEPQFGRKN
jgi:hypothetical protein